MRSRSDSMLHSCLWNAMSFEEVLWFCNEHNRFQCWFESFASIGLVKFFHWQCWWKCIDFSEKSILGNVLTLRFYMFAYNIIAIPINYSSSCWHSLKSHIKLWKGSKEIFQSALEENWSKEGIKGFLKAKLFRIYVHHWHFISMSVDFIYEGLLH